MSHPIQNLTFRGAKRVRVFGTTDQPVFVAADVCACLGLENVARALGRLDADDITSSKVIDSSGREQATACVNESGLYSLVLSSRKPEAKAFKRWVTSEVLPAIRKHGRYEVEQQARELAFQHFLTEVPDAWKKTFSDDWFAAVLGVWGVDYVRAKTPGFVGTVINDYVYEPLVAGLPEELKARRAECGKDGAKLHQFLKDEARQKLSEHLAVVKALALNNRHRPESFREAFNRVFCGRDQLTISYAPARSARRARRHVALAAGGAS
jgi:prophage antirepressor-like protein